MKRFTVKYFSMFYNGNGVPQVNMISYNMMGDDLMAVHSKLKMDDGLWIRTGPASEPSSKWRVSKWVPLSAIFEVSEAA